MMAFHDGWEFCDWIEALNPEYVWIGGNSKPKEVQLPEPSREDLEYILMVFEKRGIEYRLK
jgi:hypothetical protein